MPPALRPVPQPAVVAALWMVGTLLSFSGMAIGIREVSDTLGTFQILVFRSLIGLCALALVVSWRGWRTVVSGQPLLQLARNVVHVGGQASWVYGLAVLPLAQVFALEFTTPIWAAVIAVLALGERLTVGRAVAIVVGFFGVLVILRPGMDAVHPAALVVLFAALCYAITHIATKRLTRTDGPLAVLFWMSALQLPMTLLPALWRWAPVAPGDAPWLLLLGLGALSAHYCLTRALALADATLVVPMDFLRLPLIALVGFLAYAEPLDPAVLLGGAIIFAGIYVNLWREARAG